MSRPVAIFFLLALLLLSTDVFAEEASGSERSLSNDDGAGSGEHQHHQQQHSYAKHLPHHARILIPTRMQLGRVSHAFSRPGASARPAHIRLPQTDDAARRVQQQHPVSHKEWIPFDKPFRHFPVHVLVGISDFVTEQEQVRIRAYADGANATGFFLVMGTWLEPHVKRISASWLATDLPPQQVQLLRHEQFMRSVEWGVAEQTFSPPLVLRARTVDGATASSGEEEGGGDDKGKKLMSDVLSNKLKPTLLPVISKLDQRADAYWAKFEVQTLSVTPIGFTSVLRPWGDAPTFWVAASYLATSLPLSLIQAGEHSAAHERLGAHVIRFEEKMLCDVPEVLVFTTLIDQGPVKRGVSVIAQGVTNEKFELFFDLRMSAESIHAKFSWIAVC